MMTWTSVWEQTLHVDIRALLDQQFHDLDVVAG
jgi:hypothetical protein